MYVYVYVYAHTHTHTHTLTHTHTHTHTLTHAGTPRQGGGCFQQTPFRDGPHARGQGEAPKRAPQTAQPERLLPTYLQIAIDLQIQIEDVPPLCAP